MAIRVFLVDDHELIRRGLRAMFDGEPDFELVGEAATAAEAIETIPKIAPDVALLDIRLPDGSGIDVCREVRERAPEVQCLMLTSFEVKEDLFRAIQAGASGYLLKQARAEDLLDALRKVAVGQSLIDPHMTGALLDRFRKGSEDSDRLGRLTRQEREILRLIGKGMTNREIAEQIHLTEKTVKNYVSNLLVKLGMSHRTQAALFAARLEADWPRSSG